MLRLALRIAMLLVPAAALAALLAGCADTRPKIVILFGVDPELEGTPVEIDGTVAGRLQKFGDNPRTAFLVDRGMHTVRLLHPRWECQPATVEVKALGVQLLVDMAETVDAAGQMRPALLLRQ